MFHKFFSYFLQHTLPNWSSRSCRPLFSAFRVCSVFSLNCLGSLEAGFVSISVVSFYVHGKSLCHIMTLKETTEISCFTKKNGDEYLNTRWMIHEKLQKATKIYKCPQKKILSDLVKENIDAICFMKMLSLISPHWCKCVCVSLKTAMFKGKSLINAGCFQHFFQKFNFLISLRAKSDF